VEVVAGAAGDRDRCTPLCPRSRRGAEQDDQEGMEEAGSHDGTTMIVSAQKQTVEVAALCGAVVSRRSSGWALRGRNRGRVQGGGAMAGMPRGAESMYRKIYSSIGGKSIQGNGPFSLLQPLRRSLPFRVSPARFEACSPAESQLVGGISLGVRHLSWGGPLKGTLVRAWPFPFARQSAVKGTFDKDLCYLSKRSYLIIVAAT
jgi:hypothetical protein